MTTWTALQHVPHETPGLITAAAKRHGIDMDVRRMWVPDPLPRPNEVAGLVVMGGPMGAFDDAEYPFLAGERALLGAVARAGRPVLGVCLGAQLLAAALGAHVRRGPVFEAGAGFVQLTGDGRTDPVLGGGLRPGPGPGAAGDLPVLHWHHDTFDLPEGAVLLASSGEYRNQAFRWGECAYGLQFHVEVDLDLAAILRPHLPDGVTLDRAEVTPIETAGRAVLDHFVVQAVTTAAGSPQWGT